MRAGSFTGAALATGIPKSTLSEKIAELEKSVGATLLVRSTRSLRLTDAGQLFAKSISTGLMHIESAHEEIKKYQTEPHGKIKIAALVGLANSTLSEWLGKFLEDFPKVTIEIQYSDERQSLIESGFDIGIRSAESDDASLVSKPIARDKYILVSSPKYLEKFEPITTPSELKRCSLVTFRSNKELWKVKTDSNKSYELEAVSRVASNNIEATKRIVIGGHGIGFLPKTVCAADIDSGRLVHVLPAWTRTEHSLFVVYPLQKFKTPKLKAILPYLEKAFADWR